MLPAESSAMPCTSRIGIGYDSHRLADARPLILGGVRIAHSQGLIGHSDADVVLHALTDALLGAIGAGDIGQHFPDTDPRWKGAASAIFLREALRLVRAHGGAMGNVDVTLLGEAPKVAPHRDAMRRSIAELLELEEDRHGDADAGQLKRRVRQLSRSTGVREYGDEKPD